MNKQQLASKIWASANKMRSKIEANEYKDYILGFIFYKFLSDYELQYLKNNEWTDEDIKLYLNEETPETVDDVKRNIGYFIPYSDLFSTWIAPDSNFTVADVRDALNRFSRNINPAHQKVYKGIFDTLQNGLGKLGESTGAQTKAINNLLQLIKDIPTDGSEDYDVLGFIYEYLISNFAANAGKKAGEFYTPHEVALMMSEIVAHHLRDRDSITIYDPTSGSGSLLLNIGRSVGKHLPKDKIIYYAQELKEATYNLTRMNLVMRGIHPDNIFVRNGDTLEEDWPYFDESDPNSTYNPLYCDAVVSNPPYSQEWSPKEETSADPRYSKYGVAPKGTADYAFLLHDLFHVKPDGIMTIVLPHGVLFRGGSEETIRKNLIEKNNIDAIIGLPANIFFGTGIPTIIMVLRQKRDRDDILFVDASKGFTKVGTNNQLRARDIRKIVDAVTQRIEIPNFSRNVSRELIRENDYNLNIPRYVSSAEPEQAWDIYSTMFGGVPNNELDAYAEYWRQFPELRHTLFRDLGNGYSELKVSINDVESYVRRNENVIKFFQRNAEAALAVKTSFDVHLIQRLGEAHFVKDLNPQFHLDALTSILFNNLEKEPLVDKYAAFQVLTEHWNNIAIDLEILKTEGIEAANIIDPIIVVKKKGGKEVEVQEGEKGRIIPFELVQKNFLSDLLQELLSLNDKLNEVSDSLKEIIAEMSEEELLGDYLNNDNSKFVKDPLKKKVMFFLSSVSSPEIELLKKYVILLDNKAKKKEKLNFIEETSDQIDWTSMKKSKDGTYSKTAVNTRISQLQIQFDFGADALPTRLIRALGLLETQKDLKTNYDILQSGIIEKTKEIIYVLNQSQIIDLLKQKWGDPIYQSLSMLGPDIVNDFAKKVIALSDKYSETLIDIDNNIKSVENSLADLISNLTGSDTDLSGLREFQKLLRHE